MGTDATGDASCGSLFMGPLCAVCVSDHYYMSSQNTCKSCTDTASWFDPLAIIILLLVVSVLGYLAYIAQRISREQHLYTLDELFIIILLKLKVVDEKVYNEAPFAVNEHILIFNRQVRTLSKTYLTFYQVFCSLPTVLNFDELPVSFQVNVKRVDAVVNLGFSRSALFTCIFSSSFDFIDQLYVDTLYPIAVLLLFLVAFRVHIYVKYGTALITSVSTQNDVTRLQRKYVQYFLLFTFVILPSLAATIFKTFSCKNIDPDNVSAGDDLYLRADYSISCESSRYNFAFAWAVLMIFLYVMGIPVFYSYLLYTNKDAIMNRSNDLDIVLRDVTCDTDEGRVASLTHMRLIGIRLLFDSYKPCYWYWELVETSFRLGLTGFLVLGAYAGSGGQILIGLCLALFYTKINEFVEPFAEPINQSSKVITMWEICCVFFLFVILYSDTIKSSKIQILFILLGVTVAVNCVLAFGAVVRRLLVETSVTNKKALDTRDRTISDASGASQRKAMSLTFSPFCIEDKESVHVDGEAKNFF